LSKTILRNFFQAISVSPESHKRWEEFMKYVVQKTASQRKKMHPIVKDIGLRLATMALLPIVLLLVVVGPNLFQRDE
jgi:hypothetical protein